MAAYTITLVERVSYYHSLVIEADNEQVAREQAIDIVQELNTDPQEMFSEGDYDLEVMEVEE
jgi:allophanate hydrolase subunit 1